MSHVVDMKVKKEKEDEDAEESRPTGIYNEFCERRSKPN